MSGFWRWVAIGYTIGGIIAFATGHLEAGWIAVVGATIINVLLDIHEEMMARKG